MDKKPAEYVTVQRAMQLLICFLGRPNEQLSTQELSNLIGFHKSAVSRLLRVMENYDFLQRDETTRKYSLGRVIAELGRVSIEHLSSNLISIAKPFADQLRDQIDEDVSIVVLSDNKIVLVYTAHCNQLLRIRFNVGLIVSPHVDSGAKAILAFSDDEVRDRIIKPRSTFKRFTEKTIIKRAELLKHFEKIKAEGIAYDFCELQDDIIAFAAPIFSYESKALAAIAIGGPASRMTHLVGTKAVDALKMTANKISARLLSSN